MTSASSESKKHDDDDSHAAVVLAVNSDLFVLTQDMCVSCGSYGADSEGCLVTCTQCGQCYHPYCAQVKVCIVGVLLGQTSKRNLKSETCSRVLDLRLFLQSISTDTFYHGFIQFMHALGLLVPRAFR